MPVITQGRGGNSGGGVIYVETLPAPGDARPGSTYGRTSDSPVSLWRVTTNPAGTVATFADSRGRYKGNHNANPAAPTNAGDYYFNDNFEHFRVPNNGLSGWVNPSSPIVDSLPADHLWIDGDGGEGGRGSYDDDDAALEFLATQNVLAAETYVFYNRAEDELRTIAGMGFLGTDPRWEGVSSGTGPVPGPVGAKGNSGAVGAAGQAGAMGDPGAAGADGSDGAQGATGADGDDGGQGPQGQYDETVYQNAAAAPPTPIGGSINVETGAVTPPTSWTNNPSEPGTGENTYATRTTVNPATQTGSITPMWSAVFEGWRRRACRATGPARRSRSCWC